MAVQSIPHMGDLTGLNVLFLFYLLDNNPKITIMSCVVGRRYLLVHCRSLVFAGYPLIQLGKLNR